MPTSEENLAQWSRHDWSRGGEEWSAGWGSTRVLWYGTILPRIHFLLPADHLLEIGPGYGRVTAFLLQHCRAYTGVDITPGGVEACRERFAGRADARFLLNDGTALEGVEDGSVDAAVSWDSLVHADPGMLAAYVRELGRKLAPGGRAFLHHSNLGALQTPAGERPGVANPHWRDEHMSAALLRGFAAEAGLSLDGQQLVQWGSAVASDCFSWLRRPEPGEAPHADCDVMTHPSFETEIGHCDWLFRNPGRGQG